MHLLRIVSGGQTGVDRGALDAAIDCGLPTGGWCPRGRRADDGFVPHRYALTETPSRGFEQRTRWNVRDSDATLVVVRGELEGGSLMTAEVAARLGKPCLVVQLDDYGAIKTISDFLDGMKVRTTLNVAGPRESRQPGIQARAHSVLREVFGRDERERRFILR